jgi:hypothetical protein
MDKIDLIKLVVIDFNTIFKSDEEKISILKSCSRHRKNFDVLAFFLECGADINIVDGDGWTLLMNATWECNLCLVKFLLDNKANVNVVSKAFTALTLAFNALTLAFNHAWFEIAELLLDHNADSSIVPLNGRSASDICKNDVFRLACSEYQKKLLARLGVLSDAKVPENNELAMIVCTDGKKKISIPQDPLIKLFHDENLKLDSSMKKSFRKIQGVTKFRRLVNNKWISEEYDFPDCDMEFPEGFKGKCHILPAGLISSEEAIIRFLNHGYY